MMESPKMFKTLIGKNPDDDDAQASNGSVVEKAEFFDGGRDGSESDNVVTNVGTDGVCVEGKTACVGVHNVGGVVEEEGNLARSAEIGNKCLDKGSKCNEVGIEEAGFENAGEEMKEDAVFFDSLEVLDDVPGHQADIGEDVTKICDATEIQVDKLVDEEQPVLLKDDVTVGVSSHVLVEKQNVVSKEVSFSVGDLVWCMAKNNIWWPALILDPLDGPKQATKSRDPGKLLVRHFGSKSMVWCSTSHLKHFLECFNEMSAQGKSKSFRGAIEKAAEEVGRRVKLEMTCSCISKEIRARLIGRNKEEFKPWYVSNETAALHFDPTKFLKRVKSVAWMSYVPSVVEVVATRSTVSAYYSYYGHSQMYLRQLREADGPSGDATAVTAEEDAVVPSEEGDIDSGIEKFETSTMEESPKLSRESTAEKGFESRERKKSKYLSFPFVDPSATKALRDPTDSSEAYGKRSSSSNKRLLGKSVRKFATATATSFGDLKDLKVSSAQLLTELRDTSRGCFYLNGNTILNSTFDFFCEFRRFAFSDGDSASNWYNDDGIFEKEGLEVLVASPLSEVKPAKKRKKVVTKKLEALNDEPTMDRVNDVNLKENSVTPVGNAQTKSRKRKEPAVANHQTNKTDGVPDLNVNGDSPKISLGNLSNNGKVPEANSQPKKKKNEQGATTASEPEHEPENGIIHEPISLVVDLFIDSHSLAGLMEPNVERHLGECTASLSANTAPSSPETVNHANSALITDPEHMDLLPTDIKSKTMMEKNPDPAATTSRLPDLNGNGLELNSSVTYPKHSFQASMSPASQPSPVGQELPLSVITNNLEMMTQMLDQSGSNLSPEMKAKLENDVQSLLKKIKDMTGSSS